MSVLVVDIETTVKNAEGVSSLVVGDDKASPFHPENRAVMLGVYGENSKALVITTGQSQAVSARDALECSSILVGQNIRFDMHYLYKMLGTEFEQWLWDRKHKIWDTQLAEYLLTAQQHKWASLDELALKYGGTLKDDKIKAYWAAGVQTEDIPVDELDAYLRQDVENTYLVYQGQLEIAEMTGMRPLIESQMRALVATWEMSKNGMCFDYWRAVDQADKLQKRIDAITEKAQEIVDQLHAEAPPGTYSITSNDVLSRVLFGGTYVYVVDEPTGAVFKTGAKKGQHKTKKAERTGTVECSFEPKKEWATKKPGTYQVADEILSQVQKRKSCAGVAKELLPMVKELRALTKDRNTYFVGFSQLAWPQEQPDGTTKHFIHGKLNHCSTDTGRLSSSSPNMQNLSNKERE